MPLELVFTERRNYLPPPWRWRFNVFEKCTVCVFLFS